MVLFKTRISKALIRLRGCAGWSAPVLFANPQRQVFSRRGPFHIVNGLFSGDSLLENVVLLWRNCIRVISCYYSVYQKLFNIKLTWFVRGMMDVYFFHVYFSNQLAYKHKLSKILSLVIL